MASSHKDDMHAVLEESVQIFTGTVTEMDGKIKIWDAVNINTSKSCLSSLVPSDCLQIICFILFPLHPFTHDLLVYMGTQSSLNQVLLLKQQYLKQAAMFRLWVHLPNSYPSAILQIHT